MIEIDIEAVAGVAEPHKEVAVAKLHEEVDLVTVISKKLRVQRNCDYVYV